MSEKYEEIYENMMDMLREALDEALEEKFGDLSCELDANIQDVVAQSVNEALSEMEFRLSDGTVVMPSPKLKLLTRDKSNMLVCYGGLRVDRCKYNDGPDGFALWVQTRACSWDIAAFYEKKENAMAALLTVKEAMEKKLEFFEL